MTCDRAREWISADLDGEADAEQRHAVHRHLDTCAGCRDWRDRADRITRLARADAASVAGPAPEQVERLLERLNDAVVGSPSVPSSLPSWIPRRPLPLGEVATPRAGCHCGPDCACVTGRPGLCACGASCRCGVA